LRNQQLLIHSRSSQHCMETEGLFPCSQEPTFGLSPEPNELNPYPPFYFSKIHFNIILLSFFRKNKSRLMRLHYYVSPPITFWIPEPVVMEFDVYIIAPETISTAYFIYPSYQSACMYMYSSNVARQRLTKYITASTNTPATIEELVDASFSMRCVSFQRKVGDRFFPKFLVILSSHLRLGLSSGLFCLHTTLNTFFIFSTHKSLIWLVGSHNWFVV
jgi:hypothetical protein